MHITRNDACVLELRGRQADKEQGTGGLWLVFVVGLSFLAGSAFWLWDETGKGNASFVSFESKLSGIMASALGVAGGLLSVFGIVLALNRESLTVDLKERICVYRRWRMFRKATEIREIRLDELTGVSVRTRIETVSDGDGPTTHHRKWEARLLGKSMTTISLCRSSNQLKVARLADQVCRSLELRLLNEETDMNQSETGRHLFWRIFRQGLAVAVAGAMMWFISWYAGWGNDVAWTLASIVWITGSPLIELIGSLRSRNTSQRGPVG